MLDIKFIREHKEVVAEAAKNKSIDLDVDELLAVDDKRKKLQTTIDEARAQQNEVSDTIAKAGGDAREKMIKDMQDLKSGLRKEEEKLKKVLEEWRALMLKVPNIPHMSAPVGDVSANTEIKQWGEKPTFNFEPKSHIELMENLDMVDFDRGSKVHGFRGYFLKNEGSRLSWALWHHARDLFLKKGFTEFLAPAIVRRENFYGTGHLPNDAEDLFETQDKDYLSGTAEVPMMGYFAGEMLGDLEKEPVKVLAFSPCYRREAGSYGKDTKGLIRVHEFFKLEQLILCEAKHEKSVEFHEWINRNHEEFVESLGVPYHTLDTATGDMGQGKVRMYDVEAWLPSEDRYLEISSASYYHDFQTRRFNIKYRDKDGNTQLAHSLNCTAVATPRILAAIVENFQQEDGSVKIPEVLQPYMGKETIQKVE